MNQPAGSSETSPPLNRLLLTCSIGLTATPGLVLLLSGQSLLKWLEDMGIASEEIFRGNRLPVLHFPPKE
jgi:hypothetical protein